MQGKTCLLALAAAVAIGSFTQAVDARPGGQRGPTPGGNILAHLDADGDGVVSLTEFVDARLMRVEIQFDQRDANGDGLITEDEVGPRGEPPEEPLREEVRACIAERLGVEPTPPPAPGEGFANVDANGDGAIDLNEAISHAAANAEERFFTLDANADGVLEGDELSARVQRGRAFRQIRRECIEEVADMDEVLGG